MKPILSLLPVLLAATLTIPAQITEILIAPDSSRDYSTRKILFNSGSDIYITEGDWKHIPPDSSLGWICGGNGKRNIYQVSTSGDLVDQVKLSKHMPFEVDMVPMEGGLFAGIATQPCTLSGTLPDGSGWMIDGRQLAVAVVDTNGLMDTALAFKEFTADPDCDYDYLNYQGTIFKDGNLHVLYKIQNRYYIPPYYPEERNYHIWKLSSDLSNAEKIAPRQDPFRVQLKDDRSGFYALFHDPDTPYVCRLGELEVDGSVNILSSDLSFEAEEDLPYFIYNDSAIFTAASNHYNYTEVRKYDLDGNLLASFTTGYETVKMYPVLNGLLLIQKPIRWTGSLVDAPQPLKLRLFDHDLNEVGFREFGYPYLNILDYHLDYDRGTLTIIGKVQHAYTHTPEKNEKVYFFHGKLGDIFPPAGQPGGENSGMFYPNPNREPSVFLRLDHPEMREEANPVIRFIDVKGGMVNPRYTRVSDGLYQIDARGLSAGTYLGVVEDRGGKRLFSQLFVVTR